ncbi:LytR/AlgR family response regulator transcription factor [Neolewinella antarctica]|uniref:Two-component system LytT family response regulator n=1 Tax=Neolewinella antarctica TaxID=442734 RepID=A0ABX0X959_9BACT|nr:LytTR family DNA-binding domain-containing protein [Neolewinella antarctica]NJC25469.1 two-component system LytT family response regulator [Neolewinella antarctica]
MIKALLIDDEPAASRALGVMLRTAHPEIHISGVATTVREGLSSTITHQPDLLFLDINLPDGRGFDLIRQLRPESRPEIIFVTSAEEYAMQAIKVAALGYLVKPIDPVELTQSIAVAKIRIRQRNGERRLRALLSNLDRADNATKQISIPSEKGVEFVEAGNILCCQGVDGYTSIELSDGSKRLSSYSIGEYRKMLAPYGFFAVHRSYLVNRVHVTGWADTSTLRLKNSRLIDVSRRKKAAVKAWLAS